jgi:hypothetical protein
MQSFARVSALLPFAVLALCNGCGGGGSGGASAPSAATPTPAPVSAPPVVVNRAPTMNGDAVAQVRVGADYLFQPISDDADGDALTFTASNLPPWAEIDAASGRISGRPVLSDVGEYEAITITVADATHSIESREFSIAVIGPANGVAALSWQSPLSKCDGSLLDDLAGYRIMYGRTEEDLDHSILVNDPAATSFEFTTLDSGIWYFAVVAVNANGLEGPATAAAMKTI